MKVEKMPSGTYRVRKMQNGKTYTVTFKDKPTQREAIAALADKMDEDETNGSFYDYAKRYIKAKSNVLSPSTIRSYNSNLRSLSEDFKELELSKITEELVQIEINAYSVEHTPKTVQNVHGFIATVLKFYRPRFVLNTTLPQKDKKDVYIPTDEEVKAVLDAASGSMFEVALWLAVFGLRRSEVCALTIEDLSEDNVLTINKALVFNDDNELIKKQTKTTASTRSIVLPSFLADKIREQGYIYNGFIGSIYKGLHSCQKKAGVPSFPLHRLRHYYASLMSETLPEADVLALGGWSTPHVMKTVYRHSRLKQSEEAQRKAADTLLSKLK